VASVRKHQDLPPCLTEPVPDYSHTKTAVQKAFGNDEWECEREKNAEDTKVSEEGGKGCASGTGAEIPLQSLLNTVMTQVVPLQLMEVHGRADIYPEAHRRLYDGAGACAPKEAAARGEPTLNQAPGGNCSPWRGGHSGAGFLAGPVTLWGTHTGVIHSRRTAHQRKDPCWKSS